MPDLEELKRRIGEHPAAHGGPADVTYCLDLLQVVLTSSFVDLDGQAELYAAVHHRNPQMWFAYIAASREDPFAWKVLQALLRRLKHEEPESLGASEEQLPIFRVGFDALNDWAREVASGELQKPQRRGRYRRCLQVEDAAIVATGPRVRLVPAASLDVRGRADTGFVDLRPAPIGAVRAAHGEGRPGGGRAALPVCGGRGAAVARPESDPGGESRRQTQRGDGCGARERVERASWESDPGSGRRRRCDHD